MAVVDGENVGISEFRKFRIFCKKLILPAVYGKKSCSADFYDPISTAAATRVRFPFVGLQKSIISLIGTSNTIYYVIITFSYIKCVKKYILFYSSICLLFTAAVLTEFFFLPQGVLLTTCGDKCV